MSFIFARRYNNKIRVLADNKITISPTDEISLIKYIGEDSYRNVKNLGVIKNVIINENLCVCSAGSLEDYNELLKYIDTNNPSFDDICNKAYQINVISNNRTDFIICSINFNAMIIQVKDFCKQETDSAWIGSKVCFELFQEIRHSDELAKQTVYNCESNQNVPLDDESKDNIAFSQTVNSRVDDSVGEVVISCASKANKFYYMESISTSVSKPRVVKSNEPLVLYDNVFDGGCLLCF